MKIRNENININRLVTIGNPATKPKRPGISTLQTVPNNIKSDGKQDFKDVFKAALDSSTALDIKFSKHAIRRMEDRNIELSARQLQDLKDALTKVKNKGVKDSLILMEDAALIVNVPTRTVVTAVDNNSIRENIFTNIDGAIII
jgi:flagellar operon protein